MRARIITAQVRHNRLDEVNRLYRESLLPVVERLAGFKGNLLLLDHNTGKSIIILLWASEIDLKASETTPAFKQQFAQIAGCFTGTPVREIYEAGL